MQPRQHRLREANVVVDRRAVESLLQDLLDRLPDLGVEAVARHEDQAREEPSEAVPAEEEADARALAEVEDAHGDLEQVVFRDLEELVARVVLEDLDERLVVVASYWQARPFPHPADLAAQQRDLIRPGAVGRRRVEAQEAALPHDLALLVEALDADVVEVRGPVHRRAGVGLRQDER